MQNEHERGGRRETKQPREEVQAPSGQKDAAYADASYTTEGLGFHFESSVV